MTESDPDVHDALVSELEDLVDRAQTRDEHVRATSALALARMARDQATGAVNGSAAIRTSDHLP